MAKKSRRVRKKGRKVRLSETQLSRPGVQETADGSLAPTNTAEPAAELAEEYGYVAADLKRVAIIAGGLLVVAVALAVVLL